MRLFIFSIFSSSIVGITGCSSVECKNEIYEPLLSPPSILGGDVSQDTNMIKVIGGDHYALNRIRIRFFSSHNAGFGEEIMFVQIADVDDTLDEIEIIIYCYDQTNETVAGNTHTWPLKIISQKKLTLSKSLTDRFVNHMCEGCRRIGHIPLRPPMYSVVIAANVDGEIRGGWMYRTEDQKNLHWQSKFEKINLQIFKAVRTENQSNESLIENISNIFSKF